MWRPLVQAALACLATRHEMLRTRFVERDGQVLQAVLPAGDHKGKLPLQRLSLPGGGAPGELERVLVELTERPHQLVGAGVPVRVALIELGQDSHILQINMHHISRSVASLPACMPAAPISQCCLRRLCICKCTAVGLLHSSKHGLESAMLLMSIVLPCT